MRERPIIMQAESVQAIMEGRKTQTRRVVTRQNSLMDGYPGPKWRWDALDWNDAFVDPGPSPAGNPGPYLKVACPSQDTRHRIYSRLWDEDRLWVREAWGYVPGGIMFVAGNPYADSIARVRSPLHLRKTDARLWLEICSVRVERLHEITTKDIEREGISVNDGNPCAFRSQDMRIRFREMWNDINQERGFSFASNPWVWAITFRRIEP